MNRPRAISITGRRALLTILGLAALLAPGFAAESEVAPLPVEAAINALSFADYGPVDLSPDGKWVAYTLKDPRRIVTDSDPRYSYFGRTGVSPFGQGCDIWITNTENGESRNLTEGKGNSWYAVWSPDGRFLAFYSDREGKANLWLWEAGSGSMRRLSERIVHVTGGQIATWTPDSRQILVQVLPEGMSIEQAAELFGPEIQKEEKKDPKKSATVVVFDSRKEKEKATTWSTRGIVGDLLLLDVSSGAARTLATGFRPIAYRFSPDGKHVAFTSSKGYAPGKDFQALYDLLLVDRNGGGAPPPRTLVSDVPLETGHEVSWSPDGKTLAYMTGGESQEGKKTHCYAVGREGGNPRLLTPEPHPEFKGYMRQPLFDSSGRFIHSFTEDALWRAEVSGSGAKRLAEFSGREVVGVFSRGGWLGRSWSLDGGSTLAVLARDKETKRVAAYKVDLSSGAAEKLFEEARFFEDPLSLGVDVSDDGKKIVFISQASEQPEDLWQGGPNLTNVRRLTHINPQLDGYRMGSVRVVEWTSLDGEKLRGALLLPSGYREGAHYPLIAYPYGGSARSNRLYAFGLSGSGTENMQLFATRGYVVFLPDSKTQVGTPMRDIAGSVLSGVAKLIEAGIADPERLGVMGHSYGGYSVLSIIVQSSLFRAAVARAGVANLAGFYGDMWRDGSSLNVQWSEGGQGSMGGTPWEHRSRYIENSPWFFLDRVKSPLLIIHGGADERVPAHNADQVFVALRRLEKAVVYAKYEGEDHSELYWSYVNRLDYSQRVIAWFDEHLKTPSPAPKAAEAAGGSRKKNGS